MRPPSPAPSTTSAARVPQLPARRGSALEQAVAVHVAAASAQVPAGRPPPHVAVPPHALHGADGRRQQAGGKQARQCPGPRGRGRRCLAAQLAEDPATASRLAGAGGRPRRRVGPRRVWPAECSFQANSSTCSHLNWACLTPGRQHDRCSNERIWAYFSRNRSSLLSMNAPRYFLQRVLGGAVLRVESTPIATYLKTALYLTISLS